MSNDASKQDQKAMLKGMGLLSIVAFDLLGYTGAGIGIGWWAWKKWNWPWWIILVTSLSGLTGAFYRLYVFSQKGDE